MEQQNADGFTDHIHIHLSPVAATVQDRYGTWDDLVQVVGIAIEHHQCSGH
jgi:hypothetical protein